MKGVEKFMGKGMGKQMMEKSMPKHKGMDKDHEAMEREYHGNGGGRATAKPMKRGKK